MGREQDLSAWRLFVTTVDTGSVNAACDKLQMDPSTASRVLKALERDLGVELFNRTTRPVTLSGVGHAIADEARVMLQQQDRLLSHLHEDRQTMKGTIRIASYSALSAVEIMPLLVKFQSIYADVDFDLTELFLPPPKGFVDARAAGQCHHRLRVWGVFGYSRLSHGRYALYRLRGAQVREAPWKTGGSR